MTRLLAVVDQNSFDFASPVVGTAFDPLNELRVTNWVSFAIYGLFFIGALGFFVYLLVGAVQWIMAGGEKEGVEKAKKKITGAITGLAILFSVYAVLSLISLLFLGGTGNILSIPIPTL